MLIDTTRFGTLDIEAGRIITFREGLLGFPNHRRYALVQTSEDPVFFWLQSVDEPSLAFVVCDPRAFVEDYSAPIRADDVKALELDNLDDCQVLIIANKVANGLTGNLLGPLVIGAHSLLGKQLVLSDKRFTTRHPLAPVDARAVTKTA